jgi:enediyne biosynthesis protein E4
LGSLASLLTPYRPLRVCVSLVPRQPAQFPPAKPEDIFARTLRVLLGIGLAVCAVHGQAGAVAWPTNALSAEALRPSSTAATPTLFEILPAARTGIDFAYRWNEAPRYERLFNSSVVGGGVAVGDYDGDGLADLCLTRPAGGYQLYRNLGDCRFTNVTVQAGLRDEAVWSTGSSFADLDGDGRLDLYICCYDGPNRLYLNRGDGTFVEQAKAFGLDYNGASVMMAFGDYDRDGWLDAYLLTAGLIPSSSQRFRVKFVDGRPVVPEELQEFWQLFYLPGERASLAEAGQFDHLFHNNGDGTFQEVSKAAGITGCSFGNAVLWWDYNADGWPDLYVANDYFGPDHVYRNNGNGTFTDVTSQLLPHTPWTSMGADAADLNNDGLIDLIASDMSGTTHFKRMIDMIDTEKSGWFLDFPEPRQYMRNALFYNTGKDQFLEAAFLTGMADTDWTWSILLGDLDNDGRVDVFVPNGMTRDWMDTDLAMKAQALPPAEFARFWRAQPVRDDVNLAFQNLGDYQFRSIGQAWGLDQRGPSFGAALADLDNDGDLDLVVNNFDAPVRIHRNSSRDHHRIKIRLRGHERNRFGVGATIRLESASGRQMRYLSLAHGFMAAGEAVAHFGLGQDSRITQLTVEWPDGTPSVFRDLPSDQTYTITAPVKLSPATQVAAKPATLFTRSSALPNARHTEAATDGWARQSLLPWRLSQLSPGLAWGDANNDGHDDVYLGGSLSKPGGLFLSGGKGQFQLGAPLVSPSPIAEMAPLFFDADSNGSLDLLVVSGGVECEPEAEMLRDRLYLNDGQGRFSLAPDGVLPDLRDSGSTAVAADFDRDGDLDLFIGGRSIPGKYPLTPSSRLLVNDQGRFVDRTDSLAVGLRQSGLVTSAIWSDVDADGWLDLLVACEWGPVRLFRNAQGQLAERTREAGLAEHLGWWTSLVAGDIDRDGDIDYVAGNLGLNTRYQPSPAQPCLLHYGDFAGQGHPEIIEAVATPDGLLPVRGKTTLEKVIPGLREKFPTHHLFAAATLTEIVGAPTLEAALKFTVTTAESTVLRNNGRGGFQFEPLPRLAQIAPVHGLALVEVNGDGHLDLVLAQNSYRPIRETGRMDGGIGLLLLGRGDGSFAPVWPDQSGLVVPGDARGLATGDLNGDGWPDVLVSVNNGELHAFENTAPKTNRLLCLKLQGQRGNPTAVGARIVVQLKQGGQQVAEVYAGGGYLSQSESTLRLGLGPSGEVARVEVRWPRGKTTQHQITFETGPVLLKEE